ncbi:unnamed protein product [Phytomonas sp. Hart1]|nr:unnamed protein product [Phytomonas sp. Hart1]|eukprot:CCW72144.1 unnamed protein product [Phytomonas sp. isolate Hart1]
MFSGLKGRLQQKQAAGVSHSKSESALPPVAQTGESLLTLKGASHQDNSKLQDPYALSVHTALYNRKRERGNSTTSHSVIDAPSHKLADIASSSTEDADRVLERPQHDDSSQLEARSESNAPAKDPINSLAIPLPSPCILSEDKIVSQRNLALHSLAICMRTASCFWNPSGANDRNGISPTLNFWGLPTCVESYLDKVFLGGDEPGSFKGKDDVYLEDEEFQLLKNVCEELGAKQESVSPVSYGSGFAKPSINVDMTVEKNEKRENTTGSLQLARLIHAIWYLITSQWRHAVLGVPSNSSEASSASFPSTGWCYLVYLHKHHMLPDTIKNTKGYDVALQLEAWREAQRVRRNALELLALLVRDYRVIGSKSTTLRNYNTATQMTSGERKKFSKMGESSNSSFSSDSTKDEFFVPREVRRGLEDMIVKSIQNERNFTAARQLYTDLTLGTANWKVGLFSAGEVHMRRSIERVERNHIVHLLNNERAMKMLHSMRELMNVAEKALTLSERTEFFIQS